MTYCLDRIEIIAEILREQNLWECDANSLRIYKNDINRLKTKYKNTTYETESKWSYKANKGDKEALDHLILSHLYMVPFIARRYQNLGLNLNDLICEGNIGLINAAYHAEKNLRCRFATIAKIYIRGYILSAIKKYKYTIHYSGSFLNDSFKIQKIIAQNNIQSGMHPQESELEEKSNIERNRIIDVIKYDKTEVSLERMADIIFKPHYYENFLHSKISEDYIVEIPFSNSLWPLSVEKIIYKSLDALYDREREIIQMFFGIKCEHRKIANIADTFDLKETRVHTIINIALKKMKNFIINNYKEIL